jgi:hypothetical protein
MSLLPCFLSALGLFAPFQFLILPRLRHTLRVDGTVLSIRRAAFLSLLGWVRSVLLLAALSAGGLLLLVLVCRLRGGGTIGELSATIESLERWRDRLAWFSPYWSGGALIALVALLGLYAYRRGKVRLERAFREVYEQQMSALVAQANSGQLPDMPPTPDMDRLKEAYLHNQGLLAQLETDPNVSEPQRQAIRAELQRRLAFCRENWVMIDLHRRLALRVSPDVAAPPPPQTRLARLQTFLLSQGLLVSLNRTTRLLYLASLALLVACLVGVGAPGACTTLTDRVVALDDLRVRLSREQVQREWQEAKAALGDPQAALTPEDEKILNRVAAQYERSVSRSDLWRHAAVVRPSAYKLRSLAVQDRILEHVAQPPSATRPNPLLERHASLSRVEALRPEEKFVTGAYEQALDAAAPATKHGQRFLGELRDVARRSPTLMERLRAEVRLFRQPVRGGALGSELTNQVLGVLTGGENPEFAALLAGVDRDVAETLMNRVLEDHADHALARLARGDAPGEVLSAAAEERPDLVLARLSETSELKQVVRTVVNKVPTEEQVLTRLRDYPPGIDVRAEPHLDVRRASQAVEHFYADTKQNLGALARARGQTLPVHLDAERFTKALATYGDDLPAQLGAEGKTLQSQLLSRLEPKARGPGAPAAAAGEEINASRLKLFQGRDFNRLRGFNRVGGVLIGNDPARRNGAPPDVVDLHWEEDGPNVRLGLVSADGQTVWSRPCRRSLVHLALVYAADGRKVAVTIADAYPLGEHSILLHPALVDTPLGVRVIELDQFILRYTRDDEQQRKAVEGLHADAELYRWAWGKRVLTMDQGDVERIARLLKEEFRGKVLEEVRQVKEHAREVVDSADPKLLAQAWARRGQFADPQQSPWTARGRYYDANLVRLITKLAESSADLNAFRREFDGAAARDFRQLVSSFDGAVHREDEKAAGDSLRELFFYRLAQPPSFGLRYIVREQSFAPELSQLVPRDAQGAGVPFDFFLQLVFTSEPGFAGRSPEPAEGEEDDRWWEFAALSGSIRQQVTQGVAHDGRAQAILADVAEFTSLQRLFRAALNGHLGERFAVEKLVALTDATASPAGRAPTRTLRWDMREGPAEVVAALGWLQVLGRSLPRLDTSWEPTWLDRLKTRSPLEEADLVQVLGEWSGKLEREVDRLPANSAAANWSRTTRATLEPYRRLVTEAAAERQHFRQAMERQEKQAKADPNSDLWRREWEKEFDAHARWHEDWGRRWQQARDDHKLAPAPGLAGNESAPVRQAVEALQMLAALVEQTQAAQELRAACGVARDERQTLEERAAPLPGLDW